MNTRALLNVPYGVYDSSNFFEFPDLQPSMVNADSADILKHAMIVYSDYAK